MGSSYRSDLNNGMMEGWEMPLRGAVNLVNGVMSSVVHEALDGDDSPDDGGLLERLIIVESLISHELPEKAKIIDGTLNEDCYTCYKEANVCQDRMVGSLYIATEHKSPNVERWGVYVQGDGSLSGDTHCLGIFWDKSVAEMFMSMIRGHHIVRNASKYMKIFPKAERKCDDCGAVYSYNTPPMAGSG